MKESLNKFARSKIFVLFILLAVLIVVFSIWAPAVNKTFLAASTLRNILQSIVTTSFLTIGAGCLLISGNIDLAMSSIGCFGGVIIAELVIAGLPWWVAILGAFACCAVFGCINGFIISRYRFPAFIATLGVSYIARGATYLVSAAFNNGQATNANYSDAVLSYLANGRILGIPIGVYVMIVLFIIYGVMITKTRFGMKMMMVGGNPKAAYLAGINSERITFVLFINAAIMGCIAALFSGARLGQASLNALATNQFTGMTAAMIGGISFGGGRGGMGGAFVGLLILNTFLIGMNTVGVNPFWVTTFSGILLILALTSDQLQEMFRMLFSRKNKKEVQR